MKIVIGGAGKVGSLIIEDLEAEDHEIILIEKNAEILEDTLSKYDISGLQGSIVSVDDLRDAGVESCDFYIAASSDDEINMISSIIADRLGAGQSLARVRNPEYFSQMDFIRDSLGINQLINPELEAALEITRLLKFPAALSLESFADGRALLIELALPAKSSLCGLETAEFRERHPNLLIGAIIRGTEVIIPHGKSEIFAGDRLMIIGSPQNLGPLYRDFGSIKSTERRAMVVGGGRITHYLLAMMRDSHMSFTIFESKPEVAEQLAIDFPEHRTILGDGTDYELLAEYRISQADIFIALTGVDEENILTSIYAKKSGVPRNITKVNRLEILEILAADDVEAIITPKRLIADRVLRLVRSSRDSLRSNVESLHRLANNKLEALEFSVNHDASMIGVPISDLKLKQHCLVALIMRGQEIIFPTGRDCIQAGDHILVMSLHDRFDDIEDILITEKRA